MQVAARETEAPAREFAVLVDSVGDQAQFAVHVVASQVETLADTGAEVVDRVLERLVVEVIACKTEAGDAAHDGAVDDFANLVGGKSAL